MGNINRQGAKNAKTTTDDPNGNSWPRKGAKGSKQKEPDLTAETLRRGARKCLDVVYIVNESNFMATIVQSCRIGESEAALLAQQAKRRHLEVSTLSSLYLKEKALEEEYPGIGFRDSVGGREAYVHGHRVAVWEVADVY